MEIPKGWRKERETLVREYDTGNWKRTIFVVNAIAGLAEARWHHPDLEVSFKKVKIKLTTHEAGKLTEKDYNLAQEIENLVTKILEH